MKKQTILHASAILILSSAMAFSILTSCEGPQGVAGKDGIDGIAGIDGVDANENCKQCHNPTWVTAVRTEFSLSKHKYGEAAFEEAGIASCAPCHESEAFKYVVKNNIPSTFVLNTANPPKYTNSYVGTAGVSYGELSCGTCHINLHMAYDSTDIYPLTTTAAVSMSMWAGAKEINLTADDGISNLCVKCHQPRPLATSSTLSDGNVVDYNALAANKAGTFFAFGDANNKLNPSYRTHVHYGTVGAVCAGKGGVEFVGTLDYSSSPHTALASCQDCHMAAITGKAGGHTFTAKGNFNGCNTADCHGAAPLNAKSAKVVDTQAAHKKLLEDLAALIVNADGIEILHKDKDPEHNLWATSTKNGYDGYLDIFDPSTNPDGLLQNPGAPTKPSSTWSQASIDSNLLLPQFSLTNAQMGAIINFQFALREYSLGIHNGPYTKALLTNSIESLN